MKNKKSIYILIPLVLLIWGILGYRLFSFLGGDETGKDTINNFQFKNVEYKEPDSVKIIVDYRDPFTGKLSDGSKNNKVPSNLVHKTEKRNALAEKQENKPIIVYKGLVSDAKDKNIVFMFSIDNKTYLLEKGQVEDDIKVISGDTKQIILLINKRKEVVTISK